MVKVFVAMQEDMETKELLVELYQLKICLTWRMEDQLILF
jgi:hypothetical protein